MTRPEHDLKTALEEFRRQGLAPVTTLITAFFVWLAPRLNRLCGKAGDK